MEGVRKKRGGKSKKRERRRPEERKVAEEAGEKKSVRLVLCLNYTFSQSALHSCTATFIFIH